MADMLLVFEINGCRLALDASRVAAIAQLPAQSPAPLLPPYVAGLCNLRGSVVPVVDITALWGIPHTGTYRCILLLHHLGGEVALLVDGVIATESGAAATAAAGGGEGFGRYVAALLPDKTEVLAVEKLLDAVFQQAEV